VQRLINSLAPAARLRDLLIYVRVPVSPVVVGCPPTPGFNDRARRDPAAATPARLSPPSKRSTGAGDRRVLIILGLGSPYQEIGGEDAKGRRDLGAPA